jgi:rubrerythrin
MSYKTTGKKRIAPVEPPCRKAIYQSREEAEDMIRHLAETLTGKEIRAYRCDVCGFWHLTSRGKPEKH